jgi:hypothetical protein
MNAMLEQMFKGLGPEELDHIANSGRRGSQQEPIVVSEYLGDGRFLVVGNSREDECGDPCDTFFVSHAHVFIWKDVRLVIELEYGFSNNFDNLEDAIVMLDRVKAREKKNVAEEVSIG